MLQTSAISEFRWCFILFEHFSKCIVADEDENSSNKLGKLLDAYSELVTHLLKVSYPHLNERDQVALIHSLTLAKYCPRDSEIAKFANWLENQLERVSSGPLLQYRLLSMLISFSESYTLTSQKLIPILHYYLVHEHFQICAKAQNLFSVLVQQKYPPIIAAITNSNTLEYVIESIVDVLSNTDEQAGKDESFEKCFEAIFIVQAIDAQTIAIHANDICSLLYKNTLDSSITAVGSLKTIMKIVSDDFLLDSISTDDLLQFIIECSSIYYDRIDITRLLFNVARYGAKFLNLVSSATLFEALLPLAKQAIDALSYVLNNNECESQISSLIEAIEPIIEFLPLCHQHQESFYSELLEPLIFDNFEEVIKFPQLVDAALNGFFEIFKNPSLLKYQVHLLRSRSLLRVISDIDNWYSHNWRTHRLLLAILEKFLETGSQSDAEAWDQVFTASERDSQSKKWISFRGAFCGERWSEENEKLICLLDLSFVAILMEDFEYVSYLLDYNSQYGNVVIPSSWKERLQDKICEISNSEALYALDQTHIVRLCFLWASCYSYSDLSHISSTNTLLIEAMTSTKLNFENFVPLPLAPLGRDAPLPNALLLWIAGHSTRGLSTTLLRITQILSREICDEENSLQSACMEVLSTHPKFVNLLVKTYSANLVIRPVMEPLEALKQISKLCKKSRPNESMSSSNIFEQIPTTTKLLVHSSFPLYIDNEGKESGKIFSLDSLRHHSFVVLQILIAEIHQTHQSSETRKNHLHRKIFGKYWTSLEFLSRSLQRTISDSNTSETYFWNQVDEICLSLVNIWNCMVVFLKPSPDLIKRTIHSPIIALLWRAFRTSIISSHGPVDQALELVARVKKKKKFLSSLEASNLSESVPQPSSSIYNAILISIQTIMAFEDSFEGQKTENMINHILRSLKSLDEPHPLTQMIAINSVGMLTQKMISLMEQIGKEKSNQSVSVEEFSLLIMTSASSLLKTIMDTTSPILRELSAFTLLKLASRFTSENWLKLPQTLYLLSSAMSRNESQKFGCTVCSCIILAIILCASRCAPRRLPRKIVSKLTSPRLARAILLMNEEQAIRINLATLYHMIQSGIWSAMLKRAGRDSSRISFFLESLLNKVASDSPHNKSNCIDSDHKHDQRELYMIAIDGVMVPENMLSGLNEISTSLKKSASESAEIVLQWASKIS